ncbi:MAG: type II toxin-antitoxin system Phd/YefM family antitoxin [Spirochaetales bacterium]|nr:type II toxin-antitoxin system Phd/YefM family antitoxin [Spirochaetales bacterium]
MRTISVSKLKAHLSQELRLAEQGEQIVVTDREHPIARIGPVPPDSRMHFTPPSRPVGPLKNRLQLDLSIDPVTLLLEDRARGAVAFA